MSDDEPPANEAVLRTLQRAWPTYRPTQANGKRKRKEEVREAVREARAGHGISFILEQQLYVKDYMSAFALVSAVGGITGSFPSPRT